jgi:hypothetical protein
VLIEFFKLWDLLLDLTLQPEVDDAHIWQFSSSGVYSAKSTYEGFLLGLYSLGLGKESGRAGHQANASSSCGTQ